MAISSSDTADLIFIPAPGVGHIMSTMEIAKLLVHRNHRLSVTVLIIKPPFDTGVSNFIESLASNGSDRIRFVQLPQLESLPPNPASKPSTAFFQEFIDCHSKYVRDAVGDMIGKSASSRVSGFVVDMFCIDMIDVANEFKIPTYVFFTSNAAFFGFKLHLQSLTDDQNQDINELMNSVAELPVPSFVKPVPTKVFPIVLQSKEGADFVVSSTRRLREARGIIVNSFLELETHAIKSFSADSTIPPVYPVGPLLNFDAGAGKSEDHDVIRWLDGQPPSSVVFLCFGSMGFFEETQVKEIANALERSGYRFVWSLRRPPPAKGMVKGPVDYEDPGEVLPEGFLERTAGIGKIIGWAPQVAVLSHPAVGGFVSHCGWNSLLESLWFGVPPATWPMYAEQNINAFEMVVELGLAVEIKMDYKKDIFRPGSDVVIVAAGEIEKGIRQLMDDGEVRRNVKEMSEKGRAAVTEGGSSYGYVGSLIQDFINNIS